MKTPTPAQGVLAWLRQNGISLAPLTGTDTRALQAAVQVLQCWAHSEDSALLRAFAICICQMQESTRGIAWHAVAMVTDWHMRASIWQQAGLVTPWPPDERRTWCKAEPSYPPAKERTA